MKKLLPLLLVPVALIGIAATYTITQLTANLNPGNSTLIEVYDPAASPKSGKVLLTNYVRQSQIDTSAEVQAILGQVYQATNGTLTSLSGATPTINGDLNVTGTLTNATTQTDTLYLSSLTETNKLLGLGATTNAMVATAAMITNTWGIFDGTTTKFVAGDGTLQTPAGGAAIVGTVSNAVASAGLLAVDSTKTNGIAATFSHVETALLNTADGLPTDPGARLVVDPSGNLTWVTARNYIELYDEFNGQTTAGQLAWNISSASGGAALSGGAVSTAAAIMGDYYVGAGTAAGGYGRFRLNDNSTYFGTGRVFYETRVALRSGVSDGTDTYQFMCGWADNTTSTNVTDGVYFLYTDTINEAKWTACTAANSSGWMNNMETNTVWAGTVANNTWYRLSIDIAADASSAKFYVDGTPIATNTTFIPSAAARATTPSYFNYKHAGANQRYVQMDYFRVHQWITSTR